jgi:SAM-dependent methyltransferase
MPLRLAQGFNRWLTTPFGRYLQQRQSAQMEEILPQTAGFRAMELVLSTEGRFNGKAPQMHRFAIAEFPQPELSAICDFHNLPLPSNTVELAILNHVLDFCEYPHESLKEAARVIQPSGTLIIVGFNPFSLMGLCRWPLRWVVSGLQWRSRALSVLRMTDWLKLLGFQSEKIVYGGYNLPIQSSRYLARMNWLERLASRLHLPVGAYYIIVARKQRLRPLTNGGPEWLAKAIKPVKLTPDVSSKPTAARPKSKHDQNS